MRVLLLLVSLLQVSAEAAAVPVEDNPFWVMFVDTL